MARYKQWEEGCRVVICGSGTLQSLSDDAAVFVAFVLSLIVFTIIVQMIESHLFAPSRVLARNLLGLLLSIPHKECTRGITDHNNGVPTQLYVIHLCILMVQMITPHLFAPSRVLSRNLLGLPL